ncbi:MAG: MFS transporter [Alphaproteobacteria bacterium]|nr:MFS transporter [Alphaproteobacteria bacterium]MBU1516108.1 MFS transporter [Alphaproteobacteria bacterium]MBU2092677.1 MFS transporter [Alphaproteobacteria bacterium]MBU2153798.1 MFS transporter [Alphaproteobacteria bacterium]MBU2308426.1 MFS transporter [Alphaproteobacteria bacterium]
MSHAHGWGELRRGWPALLGGVIGMGAGLSMFGLTAGFFVKPLQAEFGWGRGLIAMSSGAILLTALTMPFVGILVDRFGARLFVGLGMLTFAGCYLGLATMPGAPWAYLTIMVVIGLVAGPATAPLVYVRAVVEAFDRLRGLALALAMSGAALASVVLLPNLQAVIAGQGWRAGYLFMIPTTLVLGALSFALLTLAARRRRAAHAAAGGVAAALPGATFKEARIDPRFWLMAVAMVAANMAGGAFSSQLQPLLSDRGVPGPTAALLGSLYAALVLIGRLTVGHLLDRFWAPAVGAIALAAPILGLLAFLPADGALWLMIGGIALIAVAQGAEGDILAYFTSRFWGLKAFGAIFGVLGLVLGVSVAVGGMLGGFLFDRMGDYRVVLIGGSLLSVVATAAILATGFVRREAA